MSRLICDAQSRIFWLPKVLMVFAAINFPLEVIAQEKTYFNGRGSAFAKIESSGQSIFVFVKRDSKVISQKEIINDAQKNISYQIDDYNFDGFKDFSFSHLDEGQGIFQISRIFLYSPKEQSFLEVFPACGDEFINLKINKKKKYITSTYFYENTPRGVKRNCRR